MKPLLIACGALAGELRAVLRDQGIEHGVEVSYLPAQLHNRPDDIVPLAEHFTGAGKPNPTRTTVEVSRLPTPIAVELKVIAVLSDETGPRLPS